MRGRKTQVERQRITAAYCRVSKREQATEGHSLAAQESRLQALAQAQGVRIERMFVDAGCSGKNLKRRAVAELLAAIAAGEVQALYVTKLDRLCRSLEDLLAIVRLCGAHEVSLVSASESIDTGSPAGKMMLHMLGAFAEFERGQIAARISDVSYDLRSKRQVYCGNTPFGFTRQGSSLVPEPAQQEALATMRRMHAEGASLRQIAAWATQNGVQPKGRAWYASSIRDVLGSKMSAMAAA